LINFFLPVESQDLNALASLKPKGYRHGANTQKEQGGYSPDLRS
jgi:hypothetical protein